jgi:hypothetical protein
MITNAANTDVAREVAVREVELRVLRAEVAQREAEALELRERMKETGAKIEDASGDADLMSAKVSTIADNRHAVLKASCTYVSDKVGALHKRLLQSEAEVAEKDEEIAILQQAVADDELHVRRLEEEVGDLHLGHAEQDQKARWLAEHKQGLQRSAAIDVWHDNVQAQVDRERADVALQRQRQVHYDHMEMLSKESATLRSLIANLERSCQLHVQGIEGMRKYYDELKMEARLSDSASKIGQEAAAEQHQSQLAELAGLQARLEQEQTRNARMMSASQAYSQHEVSAMRHMTELMSLTECMRTITGMLQVTSMHKDPLQRAVDEEVGLLHHIQDATVHGAAPPPAFSMEGPGPGRSRSLSPCPPAQLSPATPWSGTGRPRLPSTPRSRSPGPAGIPAGYSGPPGPGTWGMPALVAPITIGGAEPMLAARA